MAAPVDFSGTWIFEKSSKNFEEFLIAIDVGLLKRKAMLSIEPEIIIKQDGNTFEITTKTPVKSNVLKFKVGEVFTDDNNPLKDGPTKTRVSWAGAVLVQKSVDNNKDPVTMRSIVNGKLVVTQKLETMEAKRVFKKQTQMNFMG